MGAIVLNDDEGRKAADFGFSYRNGEMYAEGVPLSVIAQAMGTPTYVYSSSIIVDRYRQLARAFESVSCRIHYAVKANSSLSVLRLLHELGAGVDIVSGGELFRAREAGFLGRDIVFSGVGKSVAEIEQALDDRVLFMNVESEAELITIDAVAGRKKVVANIAIRVNPEVRVNTSHAYIKTGEKGNKFGIPAGEMPAILELTKQLPNVALCGVSMHLGSQISDASPLRDALPQLLEIVKLGRAVGHDIRYLDVGGGLSVPYSADEKPANVSDYAEVVREAAAQMNLSLVLEPGRFLVAESGVLLSEVLYRKQATGKKFVITDAGMNDLIRPSLYGAYHQIDAVQLVEGQVTADVVGPICESGDFFAKDRPMPDVPAGGLLAIRNAGAYGYTMASNYNTRPRPAEVFVDGDRFAVITERERYENLVRLERAHLQWRTA